ncbi:MAG TPA: CBS domain-containing protein [Candidatus Limnocylindria bacterium]|nr:CBS domain-containing protein [Candidatus Limnocylindria bacterium]
MKVKDVPPGRLQSVGPDSSLADVARRMRLDDCDSVAVMTEKRLLGIITERDLVRAIAEGVDPEQVRADVFMSADPATVTADEDVSVVAVKMMALGIRHLPVVDAKGTPVGLISARDLVAVLDRGKQ